MSFRITGVIAPLALLLGCASGPSIEPQAAQTTGAIRAAEAVGAQSNPEAALHVKLAMENHKRAQEMLQADEKEQARRLLERAEMDAELAIALMKKHEAQQELAVVDKELSELDSRLQSE